MIWALLAIGAAGVLAVIGIWVYVSVKATSRDT